jgi:hypothetical protein
MTDPRFTGRQPWQPPAQPEPQPPAQGQAPQGPPGPAWSGHQPYGAPPPWGGQDGGRGPKRHVGLIVALVAAAVVVLAGVGVGGALLILRDEDQEPSTPAAGRGRSESLPPARDTADPTKIRSACDLISAEELGGIVLPGIPIHAVERPRSEAGQSSYALRCGYNRNDNNRPYLNIDLAIINQPGFTPELAVSTGKQPGAVPVQGVGEVAFYYEREGLQVLDTAQRIGEYTVALRLYGANPAVVADPFATAGKKVLAAAEAQSE